MGELRTGPDRRGTRGRKAILVLSYYFFLISGFFSLCIPFLKDKLQLDWLYRDTVYVQIKNKKKLHGCKLKMIPS